MNTSLQDIRNEIDSLDTQLFETISKRLKQVEKVVQWKKKNNKAIYDPKREEEIIAQKRELALNYGFSPDTAEEILRCIIAESHMQEKKFLQKDETSPRKIRRKKIENHPPLLTIFEQIASSYKYFFFLESLGDDEWNNQSFLGFSPKKRFSAKGNSVFIDDKEIETTQNPLKWLEEQFKPYQNLVPSQNKGGFSGGLVGHINFETIRYTEPSLPLESHNDFYDFEFGLFLDGLVYDRKSETLEYVFLEEDRSNEIFEILQQAPNPQEPMKALFIESNFSDREMEDLVEQAKKEIIEGNVFQIVPSRRFTYNFKGSDLHFYKQLREKNPSPNMFFIHFEDRKLIGSSPEMIAKIQGRRIETYPIAGTRSRGETPQEDAKLSAELLSDEKEVAEHLMLVDMARNDLGTVCEFGSVKVEETMALKKYSEVQHLVSRVVGKVKEGISPLSASISNFPMGTVSGSPRIESLHLLKKWEKTPRGPYAGGVGYYSVTGDLQLSLAIRSLFIKGEKAFTQAGAGVVYDSIPSAERKEIDKKSAHIRKILNH